MTATDVAIQKALPLILKKNPVSATADEIKAIERLNKMIVGGVTAGEGAFMMWATGHMRREETLSEVNDAYTQRVMNTIFDSDLDINKVLKATDEQGRAIGLPVDEMTEQEKINAAIQFNFRVDDDRINDIIKNARKGLNKVYNLNNALATTDFLQALPFLPHLGTKLREFAEGGLSSVGRAAYRAAGKRAPVPEFAVDATSEYAKRTFITNPIDKILSKHIDDAAKAVKLSH